MRQETLAETLRAWVGAVETALGLVEDVPSEIAIDPQHARFYLRGYDDAKAEAADTEMLLREAQDEIANAQARVQALAAELAVRMTVPEAFSAQPAQERDG
jgi:formate-dependent nitrite reductase cytochrome c552 subunit